MKPIDNDHYELSTGRRFTANRGIIGLNADNELTEGYDGGIYVGGNPWDEPDETWTATELAELADFMIERWFTFRRRVTRQLVDETVPPSQRRYERLRLACGCHEIVTAPGSIDGYACPAHGARGAHPDVEEVLAHARQAIATHRIVTVQRGAGVQGLIPPART